MCVQAGWLALIFMIILKKKLFEENISMFGSCFLKLFLNNII